MPDGNCKVLSSLIILWLHFETAKCICDILLGSHFNQYVFFFFSVYHVGSPLYGPLTFGYSSELTLLSQPLVLLSFISLSLWLSFFKVAVNDVKPSYVIFY